jgi:hypothetical protein
MPFQYLLIAAIYIIGTNVAQPLQRGDQGQDSVPAP